jgi:FimV-like protein
MISLIIKHYLTLFISVGIGAVFIFALGVYAIIRIFYFSAKQTPKVEPVLTIHNEALPAGLKSSSSMSSMSSLSLSTDIHFGAQDLVAIAGDDLMATQLDLARAYIESGNNKQAKTLLNNVISQGSATQQQEANHLLNTVS